MGTDVDQVKSTGIGSVVNTTLAVVEATAVVPTVSVDCTGGRVEVICELEV